MGPVLVVILEDLGATSDIQNVFHSVLHCYSQVLKKKFYFGSV